LDPSAAICTWRADLASLRFDRGDYLEAARLYLENVSSRAEPIEALSCLVSCALSRDSRSEERLAREMTMQSIELGQAIEDYSMLIVESGTKPSLLTMARERAGRGVGEAAISAVLDTLEGQA
jgi:hypothetical protein